MMTITKLRKRKMYWYVWTQMAEINPELSKTSTANQ